MILALALLLPAAAGAQNFGGRASVGVDYKIKKGLHLEAKEEIRTGNYKYVDNLRTSFGISYKPVRFLKVGLTYTLINPYKAGKEITYIENAEEKTLDYYGFWAPRHRIHGDVTGIMRLGDFQFSLRERLMMTHNTDAAMNVYQSTRNALVLKSRLAVKYKGFMNVEPSLAFEIRTALNEPWGQTTGEAQTTKNSNREYYTYTHTGYTHAYNNRYRINLGADINLSRHHSLSPYLLFDYNIDYVIDTNSADNWATKGVRLYTATTGWQEAFNIIAGLAYVFSF